MTSGDTPGDLDINETGARLQGWLGKTVWISVYAGDTRPILTGNGELAHERDHLDLDQDAAREFGGELRGGVFAFVVGSFRLYITPDNYRRPERA